MTECAQAVSRRGGQPSAGAPCTCAGERCWWRSRSEAGVSSVWTVSEFGCSCSMMTLWCMHSSSELAAARSAKLAHLCRRRQCRHRRRHVRDQMAARQREVVPVFLVRVGQILASLNRSAVKTAAQRKFQGDCTTCIAYAVLSDMHEMKGRSHLRIVALVIDIRPSPLIKQA